MIALKRVYDPASQEDGYRVLVDRLWPRGLSREDAAVDEWAKALAPSNGLRKWYGHAPERWEEFRRRYREELATEEARAELDRLRAVAREQTVTLLFAARDESRNNAAVLRQVLEETGGR